MNITYGKARVFPLAFILAYVFSATWDRRWEEKWFIYYSFLILLNLFCVLGLVNRTRVHAAPKAQVHELELYLFIFLL